MEVRKPAFDETRVMMSAAEGEGGMGGFVPSRVGADLRAARTRLGWSIEDLSAALRIRRPYLEALEEGRTGELPGAAYAIGFVRSYAQAMGLDPDEIGRRFRAEAHEVNRKTELSFPAPVPERGVPAGAVVLLGLVLAVGAYATWYKVSSARHDDSDLAPMPERLSTLADRAPPSPVSPQIASILPPPPASVLPQSQPIAPPLSIPSAAQAAPVPPPAPLPVPVPVPVSVHPPVAADVTAAPPPDASRVTLKFRADSYVQVREKQGPVLLSRVMHAGESWPVPREPNLVMTTGNAGGTDIVVDGLTAAPLGGNGVVRREVSLDPEAIKLPPGQHLPAPPRGTASRE